MSEEQNRLFLSKANSGRVSRVCLRYACACSSERTRLALLSRRRTRRRTSREKRSNRSSSRCPFMLTEGRPRVSRLCTLISLSICSYSQLVFHHCCRLFLVLNSHRVSTSSRQVCRTTFQFRKKLLVIRLCLHFLGYKDDLSLYTSCFRDPWIGDRRTLITIIPFFDLFASIGWLEWHRDFLRKQYYPTYYYRIQKRETSLTSDSFTSVFVSELAKGTSFENFIYQYSSPLRHLCPLISKCNLWTETAKREEKLWANAVYHIAYLRVLVGFLSLLFATLKRIWGHICHITFVPSRFFKSSLTRKLYWTDLEATL